MTPDIHARSSIRLMQDFESLKEGVRIEF
jgi:hypothetical protein